MNYQVTVIIPTLAEATRRRSLLRAIDCVLNQNGVSALPLVVINGRRFDGGLRAALEPRGDIKTLYLPEGHVARAQTLGVEHVETPYFAFLDDDDIFTDAALTHRLALMETDPHPDLVVTNIHIETEGQISLMTEDMHGFSVDPAHSIFELSWLNGINNLFRTATVRAHYFRDRAPYMEWTALGIKLAREKRIAFSNRPTAIYHNTTGSASKQQQYLEAQAKLMASLQRRSYQQKTSLLIDRKLTGALNSLSLLARADGKMLRAWRFHLACLASPGGWRYLGFTRKLIFLSDRSSMNHLRPPHPELPGARRP